MNAGRQSSLHWLWLAGLLVGLGMTASGYLLVRTFALLTPAAGAAPDICSTLFKSSCDSALSDGRSWVLGIPLAGWGLVYFSMLAAALTLARFVEGAFEAQALIVASALSAAGAGIGIGLALTFGTTLGVESICPMCVSIHAVSLALCLVLQRAIARPLAEQLQLVRQAPAGLFRSGAARESTRWPVVGFGCVVLVAAVAWQWVYVESALRRPRSSWRPQHGTAIASYLATPQHALPVSESDAHHGPLGAAAQLVVFQSFQCPHCQRFAATLPRLEREFGDRLLVVFKHYPLSSRCNERLNDDIQPDACEIAWAAEAAHQQARFWQFHDAILAEGQRGSAANIEQAAHRAGLEPARFEADRRSSAVRERVGDDIGLGNRLRIPGTPTTYLNGRLVQPASAELLEILIRHEIRQNAAKPKPVVRTAGQPRLPEPARGTFMDG